MMRVSASSMPSRLPLVLDLGERVLLLCVFSWFCFRILTNMHGGWSLVDSWLLLSEGAATLFALTHRLTDKVTRRVGDWLLTFVAAFFPLFVVPAAASQLLPTAVCAGLIMSGSLLQVMAKLTLRRSFGLAPANRGVKVGGPYRLLRHPMYAGYLLTHMAFLGTHATLWNLGLYAGAYAAQCFRILAEERVLSGDDTYRDFMKSTHWRLIPFVF
jgi:protein-S-isoprenylcysteine O-methyltransferase Ste14